MKNKIIKPPALKKGSVIGIVAPASPPSTTEKIIKGAEYLERIGYRVELGKNLFAKKGYLAGEDIDRATDINNFFGNQKIKAIFSLRGGYGTPRILDKINYNLIKNNPKIFVGYSDITALQLAIFKKTKLITFSGPMVGVEMWKSFNHFEEEFFWKMLTSKRKIGEVVLDEPLKLKFISKGLAKGRLLGGNLSMIASICGTEFFPDFKNSILFFEEIEEAPYRFDRLLSQLKNSKVFEKISGIAIGQLTEMKPSNDSPTLEINEILKEYFKGIKKPVVENLPFGHISKKITMPIGAMVELNSDLKIFSILENCVE